MARPRAARRALSSGPRRWLEVAKASQQGIRKRKRPFFGAKNSIDDPEHRPRVGRAASITLDLGELASSIHRVRGEMVGGMETAETGDRCACLG